MNVMSIDIEEWFHILNSPATPGVERWDQLEARLPANLERVLALLAETRTHATLFWLAWAAERYKGLLKRCRDAGHEIGSHGYSHFSYYRVGREAFYQDILRARDVLEDALGEPVRCFRTPGFATNHHADWLLEVIREAGYHADSSLLGDSFCCRSCQPQTSGVYLVQTTSGPLTEVPVSAVNMMGRRLWSLGGGYMRLAPAMFLDWMAEQIAQTGRPVVLYMHPRDIDLQSPCLPQGPWGHFKFVINRHTTYGKLRSLLTRYEFGSIREFLAQKERPGHVADREKATVLA